MYEKGKTHFQVERIFGGIKLKKERILSQHKSINQKSLKFLRAKTTKIYMDVFCNGFDLSGVPAGFYYIHVIKDGKTYRKQLIVQ